MPLTPATIHFDKKCGASGIPDNAKCTKSTVAGGTAPNQRPKQAKKQASGPNAWSVYGALNSVSSAVQLGGITAEMIKNYQRSGGNKAYAIAGLGTGAASLLSGLGAIEYARGNNAKGFMYNLGAAGTAVGGIYGANKYQEAEINRRKQQAETGYSGSDPFKDLGVKSGASAAEIRRAFLRKAQTAHPDKGGSADAMAKLNAAYREALRRSSGAPRERKVPRTTSPSRTGPRLLPKADSIWAVGFDL